MLDRRMLALGVIAIALTLPGCASTPQVTPTSEPFSSRSRTVYLPPSPLESLSPSRVVSDAFLPRVADIDCTTALTNGQLSADLGADFSLRPDSLEVAFDAFAVGARGGIECAFLPIVWSESNLFTELKISVFRVGGAPATTSVANGVACPYNWCEFSVTANGYWVAGSLMLSTVDPAPPSAEAAMRAVRETVRANLENAKRAAPFVELAGSWASHSQSECRAITKGTSLFTELGGADMLAGDGNLGGGPFRPPGVMESLMLLPYCYYHSDGLPTGDQLKGFSVLAFPNGILFLDHAASLPDATAREVQGIDHVVVAPSWGEGWSMIYAFDGVNCLGLNVPTEGVDRALPWLSSLIKAFDAASD